jgi:hypothetical protein
VRIDLQDAEVAVFFGYRPIVPQRGAVVAAQEPYQFSLVEQRFRLFIHPPVQMGAAFVYLF